MLYQYTSLDMCQIFKKFPDLSGPWFHENDLDAATVIKVSAGLNFKAQ